MSHNFIDLTEMTFGRWTVLSASQSRQHKSVMWFCKCICGKIKEVNGHALRRGISKSCGCMRDELSAKRNAKHGGARLSEYSVWSRMKNRCFNKGGQDYKDYGGRGISICNRWLGDDGFKNFLDDMGERPSAFHSIERLDFNGNYSPENCCWATSKEQTRNYRRNIFVELLGGEMCLKEACERAGANYKTVYQRLRRGWTLKRAIEEPLSTRGGRRG